ncbi:MAG: hypothetical protein R2867_43065 [Caldilineaceae bacterium]
MDEADSPRTLSELAQHFAKKIRPDGFMWVDLFWPIEWLSRKGSLQSSVTAAPDQEEPGDRRGAGILL